jgi:ornithine cyclodeaminase/alanine dehydrogenase-like protein (mu-crystallin family)
VPEIRVYSRSQENRRDFIADMEGVLETRLVEAHSVDEALDGAELVSLATKSTEPVIAARHVVAGRHVSSVGSARPVLSELEPDAFAAFDRVVCDSVELVFDESGDAIAAEQAGVFSRAEAADLAGILETSPSLGDASLFKSTGTGLQDLALAMAVLEAARADGAGYVVEDLLSTKPLPRLREQCFCWRDARESAHATADQLPKASAKTASNSGVASPLYPQ